ncbi:MAG: SDR family NAD(P)-dependent oxidoreductase [Alphaproteobacteria bacterium]|nr:SDR family NAD(P)-dependent oxidoreductase [Alphaproteobacteria bacterium]
MGALTGKVALITGGGTGIGKGIAERFAREGMTLAVAGLDQAKNSATQYYGRNLGGYTAAKQVAAAIGNGAIALEADVTNSADVQAMVAETAKRLGRVDVMVNCAGVITARPIAEMTEDEWDSIMDVNAKGTFLTNQATVAQMRKQGDGGRIINIASVAGKFGTATLTHYCASKFAVVGFTNALAKEVAREAITVNCICPGIVATQMWVLLNTSFANPGETPEQVYARAIDRYIPQGVEQTVADMADMAVFLATAPHVTGQAYNVDGGMDL